MSDETEPVTDDQTPAHVLMTLRVSRNSGRTRGPEIRIMSSDDLKPLMNAAWPPCECHRCGPTRKRELREALRERNRWSSNGV